ncbi:hypothetical protein COMA2_220034 [Candidatus Nitrospira nitrificans]|uniref:Uncharacterized protein n=1 Tax=Candidatus Nitrospira nitrificans TaxID=1742973 RepID=A0A0S4LK47_9BACT|nr:hypothetical protein COMA2_220034 [Candidatus Nitrospira nitrificans]
MKQEAKGDRTRRDLWRCLYDEACSIYRTIFMCFALEASRAYQRAAVGARSNFAHGSRDTHRLYAERSDPV